MSDPSVRFCLGARYRNIDIIIRGLRVTTAKHAMRIANPPSHTCYNACTYSKPQLTNMCHTPQLHA